MVVEGPNQAVANAKMFSHCVPGRCLQYTRGWLEIPPLEPDAKSAWLNNDATVPGDRTPPRAAPLWWRGGEHWHIGLGFGATTFRGTDMPSAGWVSTQLIDWIENNWGYEYMGWAKKLNGVEIPYLMDTDWRSKGAVYVGRLEFGVRDSDSVAKLRYVLHNHPDIPNAWDPGYGQGYGNRVLKAVRYWQRNIAPDKLKGPKDGTYLSNPQANNLFGPTYTVLETANPGNH